MLEGIQKFILTKILRRKYKRSGKCKCCGGCCTHIYIKHYKHVLKDEEEFKKLQYLFKFYADLELIGKDETGLIFKCKNLDEETKLCKIHFRRPPICRRYPQEELFAMGGALAPDCGYKMEPIISFKEVMESVEKKNKIIR